ncbi:hypothetical protein AB4K20DRAFT_1985231 [Rhizopus microsporus]
MNIQKISKKFKSIVNSSNLRVVLNPCEVIDLHVKACCLIALRIPLTLLSILHIPLEVAVYSLPFSYIGNDIALVNILGLTLNLLCYRINGLKILYLDDGAVQSMLKEELLRVLKQQTTTTNQALSPLAASFLYNMNQSNTSFFCIQRIRLVVKKRN